jgi:hypothetical protein
LTSGVAALNPVKGAAIGGALNGGILTLTKGLKNELACKKIGERRGTGSGADWFAPEVEQVPEGSGRHV